METVLDQIVCVGIKIIFPGFNSLFPGRPGNDLCDRLLASSSHEYQVT